MRNFALAAIMFLAIGFEAAADDGGLTLAAPESLRADGFLKYVMPRFSLKTGIRIEILDYDAPAKLRITPDGQGRPVFEDGSTIWHLDVANGGEDADAFADWLSSEVGHRAIEGFQPNGQPVYTPVSAKVVEDTDAAFEGDAVLGKEMALLHCGRCHQVTEENRMNTIGSTPSFGLLRTFPDWDVRFAAFFTRPPHGAFTQVEDVTEPFGITRPSPIVPMEITLDELDAILAFVTSIPPADLGAPLTVQ